MANNVVRVEIDVELEIQELLLLGGDLAAQGAEFMVEEVKSLIRLNEEPSRPGDPPHSSGRLRDSFFASKPKVTRDGRAIVAYAWSKLTVGAERVPLPILLDQGFGPIEPRPFLTAAARRAQARLDGEVQKLNARLRARAGG